jgi:hypothetical protein
MSRWAERGREPFEFARDMREAGVGDDGFKQRERRPQSSQRDPCLMQRLGIGRAPQKIFIQTEVPQACSDDLREGFGGGRVGRKLQALGLDRAERRRRDQPIAALPLGQDAEADGDLLAERARECEDRGRRPAFQLELELRNRRRAIACRHASRIRDDLDRSVVARDEPLPALDRHGERRPDRPEPVVRDDRADW